MPGPSPRRTLFGDLIGRLRTSQPAPPPAHEEEAEPARVAEVDFAAYAEDCLLFGFIRLDAERLTDALNEQDGLVLADVLAVALADARASASRALVVARDELLVVRASGPRGNPARRRNPRLYPVIIDTGPYRVRGHLHGPPASDPLVGLRHRPPMVPLTDAWISYTLAGAEHRARAGTLIVNRAMADSIRLVNDEDVRSPSLPFEPRVDPRAKDLTGYLRA